MPWLDDLITVLNADGVGTLNTDIFATSKVAIPILASGFATLHLIETTGTAPHNTQNDLITPAYLQPTAQVASRSSDPVQARAKLVLAQNSLYKIRNQLINGVWYVWVKPIADIGDVGVDERGQAKFTLNVIGRKKPS